MKKRLNDFLLNNKVVLSVLSRENVYNWSVLLVVGWLILLVCVSGVSFLGIINVASVPSIVYITFWSAIALMTPFAGSCYWIAQHSRNRI